MHGIILRGAVSQKRKFINKLIQDNKIPQYNLYYYFHPLKISDARDIKRIISIKSDNSSIKAIIILDDPTIEAQSALLKTLEELPESATIIFAGTKVLLSTVVSRCQVVDLAFDEIKTNSQYLSAIDQLISEVDSKRVAAILLFSDKIFSNKEYNIDQLILATRKIFFDKISQNETKGTVYSLKLLKTLNTYNSLFISNNLNARIAIEKELIRQFI